MGLIRQLSGGDTGPVGISGKGLRYRYASGNPTRIRGEGFVNVTTSVPGAGVDDLNLESGDNRLLENGDALLLG